MKLILICGPAGSGKTMLSKKIAKAMPEIFYVDKDLIQDAFTTERGEDKYYLSIREQTYAAMYRIAEENLNLGKTVLLDAPHIKQLKNPKWIDMIKGIADRTNCKINVVLCHVSPEVLKRRLKQRGLNRDWMNLNNWDEFWKNECEIISIPFKHIVYDTENEDVSKVIGFLR